MRPTSARTRVRERRLETERAILDALEKLIAERPFREITVEDVMAETTLGRTTFYRYFQDLEAVLLRLLADIYEQANEASKLWLDGGGNPRDILPAAKALATMYAQHGAILKAFADAADVGTEVEAAFRGFVDGFVEQNAERITRLCEDGRAFVPDPHETARALVWMTERYLLDVFGRPHGGVQVDVDRAAEALTRIWRLAIFERRDADADTASDTDAGAGADAGA